MWQNVIPSALLQIAHINPAIFKVLLSVALGSVQSFGEDREKVCVHVVLFGLLDLDLATSSLVRRLLNKELISLTECDLDPPAPDVGCKGRQLRTIVELGQTPRR